MPGENSNRPTPPAGGLFSPPGRRLFTLTARVSTRQFIGIAALVFLVLGLLWWTTTATGLVIPLFLPSPEAVFARLKGLAADGYLLNDTRISIYRITVGFLISTVFALPIGILIGSYRAWEASIEPLVDIIR